jgi:hypothetical protein
MSWQSEPLFKKLKTLFRAAVEYMGWAGKGASMKSMLEDLLPPEMNTQTP